MKTNLAFASPAEVETECLAVVVLDHGSKDKTELSIATSEGAVKDATAEVLASGEVTGKLFETTLLHRPAKLKAKRLLLVGGGKANSFGAPELRRLAGAAARYLKPKGIRSFAFLAPENMKSDQAVAAMVEGAFVGNFDPDTYKSDRKDQKIDSLTVVARGDQAGLQKAMDEARIIGESQNFTRELVNEPSNRMTPTILAERARKMAQDVGLKSEVYGGDKIKELKMGAFWGVAQGSDEPPALIVLRYEPTDAPATPVIGLVGKGVTFDTGGISIKPADGMEKMKYDMAGGATMIGIMRAIAALKPNVKVVCVVPSTENMPGGKAQKPGDIQTTMSGKTIEVLNTDAEGRLILADGITYAKQLGVTHIVDAATLTGAIVVALANVNVGVFGTNQEWTDKLLASAKAAGEKMWQMPMDDEYREFIKGSFADIQNIGSGKGGGAITGAMFIREFAGDTPWIHLDIAGTAWNDDAKPWLAKGPTGVALRTLLHLIQSF
jgi:leucyl aminopeptidase